jgi:ubiquinone biosynthesis protein UbiJ
MSIIRHENDIRELKKQVSDLQARLEKLEARKKPGPKKKD